ncbi:hypothetical protein ABZ716_05310 [Streptomyces sp. NPDC006687]|uniref:hypothetical protein n=1 Tax=unclassified Streptomyces TaxID=2593676 RepID=UPI00340A0FD0
MTLKSTPSTHPQPSGEMAGHTDLGRRLAALREALGLSRDDMGRSAQPLDEAHPGRITGRRVVHDS